MKIMCYVSDDGEVLSNKDHPVTHPMCVIPVLQGRPAFPADWEKVLPDAKAEHRIYRAVRVELPDGWNSPGQGQ